MKRWNLVIDIAQCEECNNCFLSCKDEFVGNDFLPHSIAQPRHGHRWVNILTKERGQFPKIDVANLPVSCMHCDNATCIRVGKGAVVKRNDGIVLIDPEKAEGNKELVQACPYGTIYWNEEKHVAQKCTLCAHLLDDGWKEPRCVQACPTGARRVFRIDEAEMKHKVREEKLEVFHPEYNTQPRVYYKNLYRYSKCFIGGDVASTKNGLIDCAGGARVTLYKDSQEIANALTDNYGDFKFDGLEEQSGRYTLEIVFAGCQKRIIDVELTTSRNVGTVILQAVQDK
jgi:Fe-S-cluster-containing dehydrogenase component